MNASKHPMFVLIIASIHLGATNVSVGMVSDGTSERTKANVKVNKLEEPETKVPEKHKDIF